jgi:hypothetical protein
MGSQAQACSINRYAEAGKLWDNEFFFEMELKPTNLPIKSKIIKPSSVGVMYFTW